MIKQNKILATSLLLVFLLSGCADLKVIMGIEEDSVSIPTGIYKGNAKLISIRKQKEPDAKPEVPEEELDVQLHIYPKDAALDKGIGTLRMSENSQRFYWRADGNNVDHWTLQFAKDNSIYSNIDESFNFDGFVTSEGFMNIIEGRINVSNNDEYKVYYVDVSQSFPPHLVKPAEELTVATEEEFSFQAEKIGHDHGALKVHIEGGEEHKKQLLEIDRIEHEDHHKPAMIFVKAIPELGLGEFKIHITRGREKSNYISVIIQ